MHRIKSLIWNPWVFNLLFWLVCFLYEWLAMASVYSEYKRYLIHASVIVPITLAASLYTVHVLFKGYYQQGRLALFFAGLLLGMVMVALLRRSFHYFYVYPLYYPDGKNSMPFLYLPKLVIEAVNAYLFVGLYSMFYIFRAWYEKDRLAREMTQEKTRAELRLLQSQVQPHFIFNTLNNIYSYAIQNNERTAELIYELSSFLSYGLYESKPERISLGRELEVIHSYVELEKIRVGERLDVSINVFDPVEDVEIPPLLLLPLIENSFKHGVSNSVDACWVRMDVARSNGDLVIKVENSRVEQEERGQEGANGLGLQNVRRRLEILYPGQHELKVEEERDSFLLIMKLKL